MVAGAFLPAQLTLAQGVALDGFLQPYRKVEISAPNMGQLAELKVVEGQQVDAGEVLAVFDTRLLDAALNTARARAEASGRIESTRAVRDRLQRRVQRLESLSRRGHAHREEVDQAKAELAVAEANLLAATEEQSIARFQLAQVERQIEQRHLRSPFAGVVLKIHKDVAETVRPDTDSVLTLAELARLKLELYVPTAAKLKLQPDAEIGLDCTDLGVTGSAVVEFVSPVIEADSATIRTRLVVRDAASKGLSAGVRCSVAFPGRQ